MCSWLRWVPCLARQPRVEQLLLEDGTISSPERSSKAATGRVLHLGDCLEGGGYIYCGFLLRAGWGSNGLDQRGWVALWS